MDVTSSVDLRCSAVVFRGDRLLAVHRRRDGYWSLPGGTPHAGEGMAACVRREVLEETGLEVQPLGCAFVLETIDPQQIDRVVDLVFRAAEVGARAEPRQVEEHLMPSFVRIADLGALSFRPPLGGHIRAAHAEARPGAAYLGNLWRPHRPISYR